MVIDCEEILQRKMWTSCRLMNNMDAG